MTMLIGYLYFKWHVLYDIKVILINLKMEMERQLEAEEEKAVYAGKYENHQQRFDISNYLLLTGSISRRADSETETSLDQMLL